MKSASRRVCSAKEVLPEHRRDARRIAPRDLAVKLCHRDNAHCLVPSRIRAATGPARSRGQCPKPRLVFCAVGAQHRGIDGDEHRFTMANVMARSTQPRRNSEVDHARRLRARPPLRNGRCIGGDRLRCRSHALELASRRGVSDPSRSSMEHGLRVCGGGRSRHGSLAVTLIAVNAAGAERRPLRRSTACEVVQRHGVHDGERRWVDLRERAARRLNDGTAEGHIAAAFVAPLGASSVFRKRTCHSRENYFVFRSDFLDFALGRSCSTNSVPRCVITR